MEQRSYEWYAARAGKITASRMKDVLAVSKRDGRPLKAREEYLGQLVVENLTEESSETATPFVQTQYGSDVEPYARSAYEAETGSIIREVGFLPHPALPYVGCSPDGLVGDEGGVEIKCPYSSIVHLRTLTEGMPEEHYDQVQTQLWVTGRQWWDFVSFDPRMPPHLRLYIKRLEPDRARIEIMAEKCEALWGEVEALVSKLMKQPEAA